MTEITFGLVRSQNPEVSAVENIEEIDSLRLINCGIGEIDNLELFHHISELNLSNNKIETLNNLSILVKLKILDVSNNKISPKNLISSIPLLPKTIISINLAGNPCADDENALGAFQDAFPEAMIAIELDNEDPVSAGILNNDEVEEKTDEDMTQTKSQKIERSNSWRLDSEEVLKSIVERKCRIQNESVPFNLDATVQVMGIHCMGLN